MSKAGPQEFQSTQVCVQDILTALQFCGGTPLHNVRNSDPSKLGFFWRSWKTGYAFLLSIGYFVCAITSTIKAVTIGSLMNQLIFALVTVVMVVALKSQHSFIVKKMTAFQSTQVVLKNILFITMLVGGFPVNNLLSNDPGKMKFSWYSIKTIYTMINSIGLLICASTALIKALLIGSFINQLISPLFYINSFMLMLIFIKISRSWMPFMVSLCKVEELIDKKYTSSANLRRKVNVVTTVIFLVAFVEHSLATLNYLYTISCDNQFTGIEYYVRKQFHYIFYYFPYHMVFAILLLIISWLGTFVWNFGDTFIIIMSIIISSRFKQISNTLKKHVENCSSVELPQKGKIIKLYSFPQVSSSKCSVQFWREVREDYNKLDNICKSLDRLFSDLVMLSYSCNLTFILAQLFNSLRQMDSIIERLYFFYSFGFVIVRTIAVSIYGAYIYEECKAIIPILNSVPSECFNQEIHRLALQIHIEPAALSGHNFFKITRGLVLNVAAAIITYELVLIQFNQATLEKYKNQSNTTICL